MIYQVPQLFYLRTSWNSETYNLVAHAHAFGHYGFTLTAQKTKFSITDFFSKCDQIRSFLRIWSQFPADLVTVTEEIRHGKLHFLCSVWVKYSVILSLHFLEISCLTSVSKRNSCKALPTISSKVVSSQKEVF